MLLISIMAFFFHFFSISDHDWKFSTTIMFYANTCFLICAYAHILLLFNISSPQFYERLLLAAYMLFTRVSFVPFNFNWVFFLLFSGSTIGWTSFSCLTFNGSNIYISANHLFHSLSSVMASCRLYLFPSIMTLVFYHGVPGTSVTLLQQYCSFIPTLSLRDSRTLIFCYSKETDTPPLKYKFEATLCMDERDGVLAPPKTGPKCVWCTKEPIEQQEVIVITF